MRFLVGLSALSALALLSSGCAAFREPSKDGQITIAAAFYPLAYTAERVSEGTGAEVSLLTQPGKEPHDLELTIKETAELAAADLVVYESGFQPAVDDAVEQNASNAVLDAAGVVGLEGTDPHFWQDPLRVATLGEAIATRLAKVDPAHAAQYAENAAALKADLTDLDTAYRTGLANCTRDTIVASHDAFGYLEKYGIHVASIVGLSPDAEPTAAALGELQNLIRSEGITTVFSEPLEPALGEGLAHDLGLTNASLDPIEGLRSASSHDDYLSLMRTNLTALRTANGCR